RGSSRSSSPPRSPAASATAGASPRSRPTRPSASCPRCPAETTVLVVAPAVLPPGPLVTQGPPVGGLLLLLRRARHVPRAPRRDRGDLQALQGHTAIVRQKMRPAHGFGSQLMAVISDRTAPGVRSWTRPAPCIVPSEPSPR